MYEVYKSYVGARGITQYERSKANAIADLDAHFQDNPDFHPDTLRNGEPQPLILTRSGEDQCYNVICKPGDQLCAGDIIDAFDEKWIVIQARADSTTHKTGVMHQCNNLFRWQNFSPEIVECWAYVSQSGYSSQVTGTNQMQKAEEQFAIYMPDNDDTRKLFVDKRLASHVAYDKFGHKILGTFKITSNSPNTKSYNQGDHLLLIKAIRDVYNEMTDNIPEMICDYISAGDQYAPPKTDKLSCKIEGGEKLLLGRTRSYDAVFYNSDGVTRDESVVAVWRLPTIDGISYKTDGNRLRISVSNQDSLIGCELAIGIYDADGLYEPAELRLEVGNIA